MCVCTSPLDPPRRLKHQRKHAFSVCCTFLSWYFPGVTRRLFILFSSAHWAFLLCMLMLRNVFSFSAKIIAFLSINAARFSLVLALSWVRDFCFLRCLSAFRACSSCSLCCISGTRGSSMSSSDDRVQLASCDRFCDTSRDGWVESTHRLADACCSTQTSGQKKGTTRAKKTKEQCQP
jgi:hypothetical protein